MALAREVESLDAVPEWAKAGYKQVEGTGKWVNEDIEDVAALKGALGKERTAKELTAKELKSFKDLGFTADEIRELQAKVEAKRESGGTNEEVEKLVAKRVKEVEDRLKPDLEERDALRAENRQLLLTDKLRADFIAAGGVEDDADDVVRLYGERFELGDKNDKGKRKITVKDDDGDPTGMSPQEWFEKVLKVRKPKFFKGTGATGGGATGGGSGGSGADAEIRKLPGNRMVDAAFAGGKTK